MSDCPVCYYTGDETPRKMEVSTSHYDGCSEFCRFCAIYVTIDGIWKSMDDLQEEIKNIENRAEEEIAHIKQKQSIINQLNNKENK